MAEYLIPRYKVAELQKKVQHIRNKGAQVTFNVLEEDVPVEYQDNADHTRYIRCDKIEIEGSYKINGWTFVATIEHSTPENIIRLADQSFENRIPPRYWTAGRECEHCHIRRDRNDTYLVYNEDADEFKQVGRTCLKSYTQGLDAETCAALADVMREIRQLNDDSVRGMFNFEGDHVAASEFILPMVDARRMAYKYVEQNGYESGETGHTFAAKALRGDLANDMATEEEADAVANYLQNEAENNAYSRNAFNAWNKRSFEFRDGGLITSAVYSYFRWKQKQAQQQARDAARQAELANVNQTAAGNVGDKVEFTIADFKVIYMRQAGTGYHSFEYPVYRIVGTDGRIYIWACSNGMDLENGMTLRGTIKKISEFRGETQTEVTRCKEVNAPTASPAPTDNDSQQSIFARLRSLG